MQQYTNIKLRVLKMLLLVLLISTYNLKAQHIPDSTSSSLIQDSSSASITSSGEIYYGTASFYSNKFIGKKTASGDIFSQEKFTAACNILSLGTVIKVTNVKNGKSVIVKTNDRLHPSTKRIVDLTKAAAKELGFINNGLAKVKVEVIEKTKKKKKSKKNKAENP